MPRAAVLALLAAAIAIVAASAQPAPPTPIRWSAGEIAGAVKPGQTMIVPIAALIDEGWHLYALEAVEGGPIPTQLSAGPNPPFALNEKDIVRPEPKRAQDSNFGTETAFYEESAAFELPIAIAVTAAPTQRDLEIIARFQACNDRICLRPQTATMKVKVSVERSVR